VLRGAPREPPALGARRVRKGAGEIRRGDAAPARERDPGEIAEAPAELETERKRQAPGGRHEGARG
jgi:hypothetical protein